MTRIYYTVARATFLSIILFAVSFSAYAQIYRDSLPTGHLTDAAEEYWPESKDTLHKQSFFNKLKHIPVNADKGFVSIRGTLREGYEGLKNYLWGIGPQDDNGYLLHRLLLHADVRWNRSIRLFAEVENSLAMGRNGGPRPVIDENKLAINQAFAEVSVRPSLYSNLKLRLGKQALNYGIGSLLDIRDANVRLSFAGGKLIFERKNTKVDVFLMEAIKNNAGLFDDQLNHSQKIAGAWMTQTSQKKFFNKIDVFYLLINRDSSHFNLGYGKESRSTLGANVWFKKGNLSGYTETDFQWGHFNDQSIQAWKVVQSIFYTFQRVKFKPVLSVVYAVSSGDHDQKDNKLQTFNPIYPKAIYYGFVDNVGSANLIDVHEKLETSFNTKLKLTIGYYKFWRVSINDGVYLANGSLLFSSSGTERHVADMYDLNFTYIPNPNVSIQFTAVYDKRAAYLQQQSTTIGDIRYLGIRTGISF